MNTTKEQQLESCVYYTASQWLKSMLSEFGLRIANDQECDDEVYECIASVFLTAETFEIVRDISDEELQEEIFKLDSSDSLESLISTVPDKAKSNLVPISVTIDSVLTLSKSPIGLDKKIYVEYNDRDQYTSRHIQNLLLAFWEELEHLDNFLPNKADSLILLTELRNPSATIRTIYEPKDIERFN